MVFTGIDPEGRSLDGSLHDTRLIEREIAYSRLGSLLGSHVALGAKKATLGADVPTGKTFNGKEFEHKAGDTGVLTEEATGTDWHDLGWIYYGFGNDSTEDFTGALQGRGSARNFGERFNDRLAARGEEGSLFEDKLTQFYSGQGASTTDTQPIDVADADFQQQMNEMFILDTLASFSDRHSKNFMVGHGEDGKVSVKAIDNDLSFGTHRKKGQSGAKTDRTEFGKRREEGNHYGGLPQKMQIDSQMAAKISGMTREELDLAFSDLLSKDEIDALWDRFDMMKSYIESMREQDSSLIVDRWDRQTAVRELGFSGGVESFKDEGAGEGGYSGNNYYQRHVLSLAARGLRTSAEYNDAYKKLWG